MLYAFAIYVIWGQFTAVESQIQQEAGALKDILLFSQKFKETVREPVVRAVKNYARAVLETEWSALSSGPQPTEPIAHSPRWSRPSRKFSPR